MEINSTATRRIRRKRKSGRKEKPYLNKNNVLAEGKTGSQENFCCKCKFQCKCVPQKHRDVLFHELCALEDNLKQNSYLMNLMVITPVKRRRRDRCSDVNESIRQNTVWYSLPDGNGNMLQVCKNTFMHVFGLSRRRIETLISAKKKGEVVFTEKRGNKSRSKFTVVDVNLITEHVNSFSRDESHYVRRMNNKEFLRQDLNINSLYHAYKEKYSDTNVTYDIYYKIFKKKFSQASFHRPSTDT
ncbi:uncharacterized protein LOC112599159 [Melanaphis sacchari]|uniref:uncharacterized protein LOC112599159 n=1 Tax=Melanaphis sacchari TaxID=742174 RepID=UPI000DC13710|nr:uncharacterized protein LOC112599159 [Melanaphis sacchari]